MEIFAVTVNHKKLFLSYAREDFPVVDRFYRLAALAGFDVFMDKHDVRPGPWKTQIRRAIYASNVFLLFLSKNVKAKIDSGTGFIEEEMDYAFEVAGGVSLSDYQIIPVCIDDSYRGNLKIQGFQQYDLFHGFESVAKKVLDHLVESSPAQQLADRAAAYYSARDFLNAYSTLVALEDRIGANGNTIRNKAVLLFNLGRAEQAVKIVETQCDYAPTPELYLALANMLFARPKLGDPIAVLRKATDKYPGDLALRAILKKAQDRLAVAQKAVGSIVRSTTSNSHTTRANSEIIRASAFGPTFFTEDLDYIFGDHDPWGFNFTPGYCREKENAIPIVFEGAVIKKGQVFGKQFAQVCFYDLIADQQFIVKRILVKSGQVVQYDDPVLEVIYLT